MDCVELVTMQLVHDLEGYLLSLTLDSHDKSRLRYGFLLRRFSLWLIKITATCSCLNCSRIDMSHFFFSLE